MQYTGIMFDFLIKKNSNSKRESPENLISEK